MNSIPFILFLMTISPGNEILARKMMVPITWTYTLSDSEVSVIRARGKSGSDDTIQKKNTVFYDQQKGCYTYRYWREDGEPVVVYYEPENQVMALVKCEVNQDLIGKLYTFIYHFRIIPTSRQGIQVIAIEMNPFLKRDVTLSRADWYYFDSIPAKPRWAYFNGRLGPMKPGEVITIQMTSQYGPIPQYCYLRGKRKIPYNSPPDNPSNFCESPPDIEGVKGLTLAPGAWPAGEPERLRLLNTFLKQAVEWGWIAEPAGRALQGLAAREPSPGRLAKALAAAARKFQAQKQAEPEVVYFLDHAEQVLTTPPVRPGK